MPRDKDTHVKNLCFIVPFGQYMEPYNNNGRTHIYDEIILGNNEEEMNSLETLESDENIWKCSVNIRHSNGWGKDFFFFLTKCIFILKCRPVHKIMKMHAS